MAAGVQTKQLRIDGMTCVHCGNKIESTLRGAPGIVSAEVDYTAGAAVVSYHTETITIQEITAIIEKLDYQVLGADGRGAEGRGAGTLNRTLGFLVIIAAGFLLVRSLGLTVLFTAFPLAESGMGYGMLFVMGLITSVHCLAMCGGINLSQCVPNSITALRPSLLYNLGRVVSYTTVGVIVGALGQVISFSGAMKGAVQLAAGVFMVIMGLNMLGAFPALRRFTPRLPRVFARRIEKARGGSTSALYVGLLNGLMPCGPLQAMQLYALSTGSPLTGGLSMLLFSLGTVPLMFGLGVLGSLLSKKFTRTVMSAGAVLVAVLGLVMFSNGWTLSGFSSPFDVSGGPRSTRTAANAGPVMVIENGVQLVNTTLQPGRYQPIVVTAGLPVRWTIEAPQGSVNGCNNRMIIREYGIEHRFTPGLNVVEFTPAAPGLFRYSCWMGMIRSTITVIEAGAEIPADTIAVDEEYYDDEEFGEVGEFDDPEAMEGFWELFAREFPEDE